MRKKTVNHLADTIFWYLIYFMPVVAYLLFIFSGVNTTITNFYTFMSEAGLNGFSAYNVIFDSLSALFGPSGVLPLFQELGVFSLLTWFASVYILHLAIDFIIFIPRLCHKWLKKFTQGE